MAPLGEFDSNGAISSALGLFVVRRRAEAGDAKPSFASLCQEWAQLAPEQRAAFEPQTAKAGAADTKRLLLQQQEAQKLRRPEPNELRELKPKRKRAKPEELPAPSFPRKADRAPSPERLAELRQQVREVQDCQGEDLASASARLLCPRLTFDWGEEEGLMVEPPQGCDLRQLLREEQQRSISVQKAQKLLRS